MPWLPPEERHRRLAEDLQGSLPRDLPRPAGVELAAVYRPSATAATVGGDFSDLVELDASSWLLVIGDVQGTGPIAASLTAAARYSIRAAAVHGSDPRRCCAPSTRS